MVLSGIWELVVSRTSGWRVASRATRVGKDFGGSRLAGEDMSSDFPTETETSVVAPLEAEAFGGSAAWGG